MDELWEKCSHIHPTDMFGMPIVPVAWDPTQNPALFPFPVEYRWESLVRICDTFAIRRGVAIATPFVWQLEPLAYAVARAIHVPVAIVQPKNLTLLKPYAEQAELDLIIIGPEHLATTQEILANTQRQPKVLLVIHRSATTISRIVEANTPYRIIHELHLLPGLPLLTQISGTNTFSRNNQLNWHPDNQPMIDSPCDWPVSFSNLALPFRLERASKHAFTVHV